MSDPSLLKCERLFLLLLGLIFLASGLFTFFDPQTMGEALGIAPMNAAGAVEIRATYGGLVVGSALLMFAGVMHRIMAVAALAGVLFGAGGLMGTRMVIQASQGFSLNQAIVALFELSMVVVAFVLFRAAWQRAQSP